MFCRIQKYSLANFWAQLLMTADFISRLFSNLRFSHVLSPQLEKKKKKDKWLLFTLERKEKEKLHCFEL